MLNSQLHQHMPHHALSPVDHSGSNGIGSGNAGNGTTNGYFIFDDLTTALQLQDRSNDQLSAISSSSLSSVGHNNGNGLATSLHQQPHSHSLPMLTSSSSSPPIATHLHHQSSQLQPLHHPFQQPSQKCNFGELNIKQNQKQKKPNPKKSASMNKNHLHTHTQKKKNISSVIKIHQRYYGIQNNDHPICMSFIAVYYLLL